MSDDKQATAQDRKVISLAQDYEVRDWTASLGCTEAQLRDAVAAVGDNNGANAIVEQIHQASAAQTKILHAQMLARIRVQGARSLVDLASPSCKPPLASVVQNFD